MLKSPGHFIEQVNRVDWTSLGKGLKSFGLDCDCVTRAVVMIELSRAGTKEIEERTRMLTKTAVESFKFAS